MDGESVGGDSFRLRNGTIIPVDHPRFGSEEQSNPDRRIEFDSNFGDELNWDMDTDDLTSGSSTRRAICEISLA